MDEVSGFVGDPRVYVADPGAPEQPGDAQLGWGLLRRWAAARRILTRPGARPMAGRYRTRLACHAVVQPYLPPATAPHTMCEAENLIIDFSKLRPAQAPAFRPHYAKGDWQYHRYAPGALLGACRRAPGFQLDRFPRDHLRDIFASFRAWNGSARRPYDVVVDHPVLFVTREGTESRNLFHATTDFLNAFQALLVMGDVDRLTAQVMLLDRGAPAAFDSLWRRVFAPRHPVLRVSDCAGRRVLFRRAIFSPPGYTSLCFAGLTGDNPCPFPVGVLEAFRSLVLRSHGIDPGRSPSPTEALRVTLVSRVSYPGHAHMRGRIANLDEIVRALREVRGVEVEVVDFAAHSIADQIRLASETDLLVGAHGAGLTHLLWTRAQAGVLEIAPASDHRWRCYEHLATWSGRAYTVQTEHEQMRADGSEFTPDSIRLQRTLASLAEHVRWRRRTATRGSRPRRTPARRRRVCFLLSAASHAAWRAEARRGGPQGEVLVGDSLVRGLQRLGYEVLAFGSPAEAASELRSGDYRGRAPRGGGGGSSAGEGLRGRGRRLDFIFLDPWTLVDAWRAGLVHRRNAHLCLVLEWFSTAAGRMRPPGLGLDGRRILTPYPYDNGWNRFLGFILQSGLESGLPDARAVGRAVGDGLRSKRGQGVVWGKEMRYFDARALELVRWLSTICPIHTTIAEARGYRQDLLPANVTNHGHLMPHAWRALLRESNFVIGLGDPVGGPTPVEALAAGCVYVNPHFAGMRYLADPASLPVRSQHPYLERIGTPFVWTVRLDDRSAVRRAVEASLRPAATRRALANPEGRGLMRALGRFTEQAYVRRLRTILATSG